MDVKKRHDALTAVSVTPLHHMNIRMYTHTLLLTCSTVPFCSATMKKWNPLTTLPPMAAMLLPDTCISWGLATTSPLGCLSSVAQLGFWVQWKWSMNTNVTSTHTHNTDGSGFETTQHSHAYYRTLIFCTLHTIHRATLSQFTHSNFKHVPQVWVPLHTDGATEGSEEQTVSSVGGIFTEVCLVCQRWPTTSDPVVHRVEQRKFSADVRLHERSLPK